MAESLTSFFDRVTGGAKPGFTAEPWYNSAGDCIMYHWADDEYFRDWIDDKLTVYRAVKTKQAVGCQIKGIQALLRKLGEFGISLETTDGTPLALFLFASQADAAMDEERAALREKTYKYLLEHAGKQRVEVPKDEPATA